MPNGYERYSMLYDVEVWVHEGLGKKVISFPIGDFAFSPKCVVILCGSKADAERITTALKDKSTVRMIESLNK